MSLPSHSGLYRIHILGWRNESEGNAFGFNKAMDCFRIVRLRILCTSAYDRRVNTLGPSSPAYELTLEDFHYYIAVSFGNSLLISNTGMCL